MSKVKDKTNFKTKNRFNFALKWAANNGHLDVAKELLKNKRVRSNMHELTGKANKILKDNKLI